MDNILTWLNQNPWLNLVFLVIAILGIIISIFLFFKSKRQKNVTFSMRSTNIFSSKVKSHGDIKVTYRNETVENLTVTKIGFWNSGNDVVNEIDQAPTDKLRIEINDDYNILDADIIFQTKETNNVTLEKHEKVLNINFDYFDPNQGFVLKILHTGLRSSNLDLHGTIKGSKRILNVKNNNFDFISMIIITLPLFGSSTIAKKAAFKTQRMFLLISFIVGIILIIVPFIFKFTNENKIPMFVLGGVYSLFGLLIFFTSKKMPKGFEVLYEDE